ncbi:MAG TPA: isochorismatase family protein [Actinomycetota bacterium]|nr:isochorismatase family protein [Actinomycetota bacterium]
MTDYSSDSALIVVDVQNDFADPGGGLYVTGGEEVVPLINREIDRAHAAGAQVFYTQDWHPETTPHFEKDGGIWPVHCVRETWGAELHPELEVIGEVVRKGTEGEDGYSGFTVRDPLSGETDSTALGRLLAQQGVRRLVVAGLATDYCVKETVLDGLRRGFDVVVLRAGVRAVDLEAGDGERALAEIEAAGGEIV